MATSKRSGIFPRKCGTPSKRIALLSMPRLSESQTQCNVNSEIRVESRVLTLFSQALDFRVKVCYSEASIRY
jgi:hypothetical protein